MKCILTVAAIVVVLSSIISSTLGQTTSLSPSSSRAANLTRLCSELEAIADRVDALVYEQDGAGSPLNPHLVNWSRVDAFLSSNFIYQDYSLFTSGTNYTSYQRYWMDIYAARQNYPYLGGRENWRSCDPIDMRLVSQWTEVLGVEGGDSVTSMSIYLTEFGSNMTISRQAYWTSGNIANIIRARGRSRS